MSATMKRLTVRLDAADMRQLEHKARQEGTTASAVLRRAFRDKMRTGHTAKNEFSALEQEVAELRKSVTELVAFLRENNPTELREMIAELASDLRQNDQSSAIRWIEFWTHHALPTNRLDEVKRLFKENERNI